MAGNARTMFSDPQLGQAVSAAVSSPQRGKGMLQRAQGTGMRENHPRVLITRVSQIISCSARLFGIERDQQITDAENHSCSA